VKLAKYVRVTERVEEALSRGCGVVALETAVFTHGLPHPQNLVALQAVSEAVESAGCVPALCLVQGGTLWIGAESHQVHAAVEDPRTEKASVRDLAGVLVAGTAAGLTVSATLHAAVLGHIQVVATGGIGGAHLNWMSTGDISADILQLARSPVVTVCSGAKTILDIPRTLELLETVGVSVFGFKTTTFPAFFLHSSGCPIPSVGTPQDIACLARAQWGVGHKVGILIGNPVPAEDAISQEEFSPLLARVLVDAQTEDISGKALTPYLLSKIAEYSAGRSIKANLALLANNARLASQIAVSLRT
jgi:pseudouridylate synthase